MSKVCDGFVDCPGRLKSDESGCEHVMVKENCEQWYADGFRQSGTYIIDLAKKLADGDNDGSFTVECEFDEASGIISTVLHHTNEASVRLKELLETYHLEYNSAIKSTLNPNQNLVGIMASFGSKCLQKIEVECFQAPDIDDDIRIIGYDGVPHTSCRPYRQDCLNKDGIPMCNVTR
ncbi:uncharacterized protein LOC132758058 [Ruditapes philippinarum]|uniref:uncharacterized protein LOC132758058 n=1 Tax=Ruditapes philippinarum TaxID=129788 RepID=UPI00295B476C|nr:uncharacterized protein LOC132758058 [Ruditapes philippinarum]